MVRSERAANSSWNAWGGEIRIQWAVMETVDLQGYGLGPAMPLPARVRNILKLRSGYDNILCLQVAPLFKKWSGQVDSAAHLRWIRGTAGICGKTDLQRAVGTNRTTDTTRSAYKLVWVRFLSEVIVIFLTGLENNLYSVSYSKKKQFQSTHSSGTSNSRT